jgi:hypothetical protein
LHLGCAAKPHILNAAFFLGCIVEAQHGGDSGVALVRKEQVILVHREGRAFFQQLDLVSNLEWHDLHG